MNEIVEPLKQLLMSLRHLNYAKHCKLIDICKLSMVFYDVNYFMMC